MINVKYETVNDKNLMYGNVKNLPTLRIKIDLLYVLVFKTLIVYF